MTVTGVSVVPGTADAAAYDFAGFCMGPLKPGKSCKLAVDFDADAVGTLTSTLVVTDNSPGSPQQILLTGTVIDPIAEFSPAKLAFGNLRVGSSTTLPVRLTNSGQTDLDVSGFMIEGSAAGDYSQTNNCPAALPATASCTLQVTFVPSAKGGRTGILVFIDNVSGGKSALPLQGAAH